MRYLVIYLIKVVGNLSRPCGNEAKKFKTSRQVRTKSPLAKYGKFRRFMRGHIFSYLWRGPRTRARYASEKGPKSVAHTCDTAIKVLLFFMRKIN